MVNSGYGESLNPMTHWARRGSTGWYAVAVGVLAWDLAAPDGETLSESFRRAAKTRHGKAVAAASIGLVIAHLFEIIPKRYDPLHGIHVARNRMYKLEACGPIQVRSAAGEDPGWPEGFDLVSGGRAS